MMDLKGAEIADEERDRLRHPAVGGLILFTRNYHDPEQIADLIVKIRSIRPGLLIAVDHEGGRVQRFRNGFTRLPPAAYYTECTSHHASLCAKAAGWVMATELRSIDVDFSFAPVLDVESGISQVIGDRSFSQDPRTVAELGRAFFNGMRTAGMAGVGKHFPGHGSVVEDSHVYQPVDRRSFERIEKRDTIPFQSLMASGIEGIMMAHVVYQEVDTRPAGYSPIWIQQILRGQFGFDGAIFSDDLSMVGAVAFSENYVDRACLALEAGCDMVLTCNQPEQVGAVLDAVATLPADPYRTARLERMRGRFPVSRSTYLTSPEWQEAVSLVHSVHP